MAISKVKLSSKTPADPLDPTARLVTYTPAPAQPDAAQRVSTTPLSAVAQALGVNRGPNERPDFRKVVAYESTATPGYTTGRSTIADILATSALHTQVVVEFSQYGYGKTLEFVYDGAPRVGAASPGLLLPREFGSAATLPVMLVLPDSAAAARANVRVITATQPTPAFILDEVGTYTLGGTEGFYRYKAPAGGTYAVPTSPDDANWHQVAPPVAGSARLQALTVAQARLLAADGDAVQPIDYVVLRGALGNVTLRGIVSDAANSRPGRFSATGFWQNPAAAATAPAALVSYNLAADTTGPATATIPLAGTIAGQPVTGAVAVADGGSVRFYDGANDVYYRLFTQDGFAIHTENAAGVSTSHGVELSGTRFSLDAGMAYSLISADGIQRLLLTASNTGLLLVNGVPVTPAPAFTALTPAATITADTQSRALYNATLLLDRATTALTFTSLIDGATGTLFVTQDATGGRALTVQAGSVGFTQDAPALAANAVTRYRWIRQGTNIFWEALTYGTVTPGPAPTAAPTITAASFTPA